jgi:hypothetical protein
VPPKKTDGAGRKGDRAGFPLVPAAFRVLLGWYGPAWGVHTGHAGLVVVDQVAAFLSSYRAYPAIWAVGPVSLIHPGYRC